jgi:plastocyanin
MKKVLVAAVIAVSAGALAVPSQGAKSKTRTVSVKDNFFSPKKVTVKKGTKVKWTWKGSAPHNVTVQSGPVKFASPTKSSGSFSKTLSKKGTYTVVCTIHLPDMKMTIKVT